MQNTKIAYFENLDALRFFAFLMVFVRHYFDFGCYNTAPGFESFLSRNIAVNGRLGVNLFFVLSGFLITYLLIKEREVSHTINVKFFYFRRMLRIWPLYFLIIILNFYIIPILTHKFSIEDVKEHILYYAFFINNFDLLNTGFVGMGNDSVAILWSIAVEEQFYFVWPVLLLIINKKYYNYLFTAVIITSIIFRIITVDNKFTIYFHTLSVMSDLAVGGLLAYNFLYNKVFMTHIKNLKKVTIALVYGVLCIAVLFHKQWLELNDFTKVFERLIMSVLFAFVIAEQCFSDNSIFKLGALKQISKLGIISYGLYCLHILSITVIQKANIVFHIDQKNGFVFYSEFVLCLFLSILMSYLSYNYFEKLFLKLKYKYITV